MTGRHRRRFGSASLLASLLVVAGTSCGVPATGDPESSSGPDPAPAALPSAPPAPPARGAPEAMSAPSTPAEQLPELSPALYDPADHAPHPSQPVSVLVEGLGPPAEIVAVGVESSGEMEVPPAHQVGWYRHGANPGEPGAAVLAGHVAYDGRDGAFRHLAAVRPGASVLVVMDDGTEHTYRVVAVEQHAKDALPPATFAKDGDGHLVLITCGGEFDPVRRSFDSNVVVWAEAVG